MTLNLNYLIRCALLALLLAATQAVATQSVTTPAVTTPAVTTPAAETCGDWQPQRLPLSPQEWQAEHQRLQPLFTQCLSSANFLAYFGAIELRTGRIGSALDTLERALLLNPQHGAAQMDYAQVLYYSGDPFAAQSLNQNLLNNRHLPPVIRQQIQANQNALNKRLNTFTHQLSLNGGYDSNLNTSPSLSSLTLTLDGEEWLLALAQGMEPRGGAVLRFGLSSQYTQRKANSSHSLQLGLNSRLSENREDQQHQLALRYQHQAQLFNGGQLQHNFALIGLEHGNKHIFSTLEAQQEWQPAARFGSALANKPNNNHCQFAPQHTLGYQDFPNRSHLNALEYRLTPALNCTLNNSELRFSSSGMLNHALNKQRAGGHRTGTEFIAQWQQPLPRGKLQVQARYTQWQDHQGYSSSMKNNARRRIQRNQLALTYLLPLSPTLLLTAQAAMQHQRSNLEVFEYQSRQLDLGIKWQF